jgi:hypothetical protein
VSEVACFRPCWWSGDVTKLYQSIGSGVDGLTWVVGDVTKWYQSHGFNTEPGWAMLVEVEEKFSERNCCRNGQNMS